MVRLPKIAIGTNKRKAHFDLSHDDETSSDFGFCQPTVVRHVNAGSSSTLKTSIGVRLSPLPCPTFGRIKLKTFNTLVPMREVFEAFDYFIKGTSVASAFKTYIPKLAPSLPAFTLRDFIFMQSLYEWSKMCDVTGDLKTDVDCDAFVNFTWLAPSLRGSNIRDTGVIVNDKHVYEFIDSTLVPIGSISDVYETDGYARWFFTSVSNSLFSSGDSYRYRVASDLLGSDASIGFDSRFVSQYLDVQVPQSCIDGSRDFRLNTVRRAFYANRPSSSAYDMCLTSELRQIDVDFTSGEDSCTITIPCGLFANWTKRGQRLFKVLNAIGIRGFMYNDNVDLPKFYAYYKAWFDNLNPGRNQQWRETSCFRLIHSYYDLNVGLYELMLNQPEGMPMTPETVQKLFAQFLVDVSNCCYVLPVDNFTAATPDVLLQGDNIEPIGLSIQGSQDFSVKLVSGEGGNNNNYPHINSGEGSPSSAARFSRIDNSLNGLVISSLLRLYKLANKNSIIGARIEDYLKTKYGYTIAQSHKLNGSEMNIKIEEIFANAGTSENRLGELGGRGSNSNANRGICKFDVDENSIFVQFVAIVPYGDYCQGNVRAKIKKNDFYQEVYDSMGKERYSMSELMSRCSDLTYRPDPASFGSVPMLWRDKVQNSLHNGAFALPSQRALFLPYSLDRLFNETELRLKEQFIGGVKNISLERIAGTVLTPSEELRYIGRTPDYGNYDRIFYDNTGYFDNFILHVVQDWDYYATMKPISQSFDTFDDDNDDSVTTVTAS